MAGTLSNDSHGVCLSVCLAWLHTPNVLFRYVCIYVLYKLQGRSRDCLCVFSLCVCYLLNIDL